MSATTKKVGDEPNRWRGRADAIHAVDEMAPLPLIYCSLGQGQRTGLTLFVRSTIASAVLERSIREAVYGRSILRWRFSMPGR